MKRNVRLFSMLLALICVVSMIPVMTVSAAPTEIPENATTVEIDGVTYKVIRTVDEMNAAASMTENIILANDLDYTGKTFKVISLNQHIFDGNGYAIYGFSLGGNGNLQTFGASNGSNLNVLRNLTIGLPDQRIQASSTASGKSDGGVFGYSNAKHLVENVTVYMDFDTVNCHVGGFAGNINGTLTLKNCKFYGSIKNTTGNNVGGLVGKTGCTSVIIENCYNYASISNTAGNAGGLIGTNGQASAVISIKNSANLGAVTNGSKTAAGMISDCSSLSSLTVENFLNAGKVVGGNVGGIMGWASGITATFKNVVNVGALEATASSGEVGGVLRRMIGTVTLENCGSFAKMSTAGKWGNLYCTMEANSTTINAVTGFNYLTNAGPEDVSLPNADAAKLNEFSATAKTMEEGIAWANALLGETVGNLVINNDGTGAVLANPTFAGVQKSNSTAGKIRLVATLNDSLRYSAVGFEVALEGGNSITKECNSVYEKLLSTNDQGFASEVAAADLYGSYLYALAIENIPTTGNVTLKVTPYAKDLNGTTVYSGDSYQLVFVEGVLTSVSACA